MIQILVDHIIDATLNTDYGLNFFLGKKSLRPGPHPAGDDALDSFFREELRKKARLMTGVWNFFFTLNDSIIDFKNCV